MLKYLALTRNASFMSCTYFIELLSGTNIHTLSDALNNPYFRLFPPLFQMGLMGSMGGMGLARAELGVRIARGRGLNKYFLGKCRVDRRCPTLSGKIGEK